MDQRFPFHDRRLVEFALAIPESQRWRGGETKYVLRRASRDLLPPAIRDRRSKGDFSYLFAAAIDRECPESFRRLSLAEDGYVDGREAQRVLDRYRGGSRRDLDHSHKRPAALLENDGALVTGSDILQAFDRLEVLESTAEAIINTCPIGKLTRSGSDTVGDPNSMMMACL